MAKRTKGVRNFPFTINEVEWLGFLDTYRTMCLAPDARFTSMLEKVRGMNLNAA